ncbi:rhamnulokinase [Enterococcus florum]|uniref:Rhamnulokinase n=1 Tax=Enterococcus florum TaxID=2480627 RepID=A0A4P5PG85_9ENTE|nr:rhamnulokinase [Enterococcus florum]GCF95298.1 rhamnulokinase [Enterococcus florum]
MKNDYIAVDIGASSGRLMLSRFEKGTWSMEELHRFKNGFKKIGANDCWDVDNLLKNIVIGLEKAKKKGIDTCYLGIDTWGVDYCLLDERNQLIGAPICYRDKRTESAIEEFDSVLSIQKLYQKTGIQLQPFNTIFQLLKEERLIHARKLLLIPDYLGFCLTGNMVLEKTNASTMQLLNLDTKKFDPELLSILGITEALFPPLVEPGTTVGPLLKQNFPDYDLPETTILSVASHDTASAVAATPGKGENWAYISSGTWSLMGVELTEGIANEAAYQENFTNEWGVQGTIRFLKNIMGMWLIQEVARMQEYQYSYAELAEMAGQEPAFRSLIEVNDPRFLNPENMIEAIQAFCRETNQPVPMSAGELARCVYDSLALCYACELSKLKRITGKEIRQLHIVGGGSKNDFLNQLTADVCGIDVYAGPDEATAIGNTLVQLVAANGFGTLEEGRESIARSFDLKRFIPAFSEDIIEALQTYQAFHMVAQ